ncbi:unnamed protein product [Leptosia nina]|uniref:Gem-associated protein 5 n=1 Tax=Leptosia nina TaxID=320188 RepID=A0AAV1JT89_9NEOP
MESTIIFPSPNWFKSSVLAVSSDGWLVYGGPTTSLCILRPLKNVSNSEQCYQTAHLSRAHGEKIICVTISPEWPEKRSIVTGSPDGVVKQWSLTEVNKSIRIKFDQSHEIHKNENEEVVGVGYSNENIVITVGSFGNMTLWDTTSNVVKMFDKFLKNFKPTCLACSPHLLLNVAVGTKQGIIFVLDLNGKGKILYKVRGQNEETINVSWCPQYEVHVKKTLDVTEVKSNLVDRLAKIRLEGTDEKLNKSGLAKDLPDDSFNDSIVQEDDMFDIYKDHEEDEFGHKKYKPEIIRVRCHEEKKEDSDFLADCLKLKKDLLDRKNAPEESIESLVNALDNAHVDDSNSEAKSEEGSDTAEVNKENSADTVAVEERGCHTHKHLLASIGKLGSVRIWSKTGKLVGSCAVTTSNSKNFKTKIPGWATLNWYRPNMLLIADGKSQLLTCNPLKVDSKNKLHWTVEHALHKRGLHCIATNAPRLIKVTDSNRKTDGAKSKCENIIEDLDENFKDCVIWTTAQDRSIVCYSVEKHECIAMYNSCGGYVYCIDPCPYDARQYALSMGDGAVRVWETDTIEDDNTKLSNGKVRMYWQNVQGKVLTIAWHPTRENILAFATAESRIGLIDTGGKSDKAARLLHVALRGGIYSLCWGKDDNLYACGGGELVQYATRSTEETTSINVEVEGIKWNLSFVSFDVRGILVGSLVGGIAILDPDTHQLVVATFVFSKIIHNMQWHPQQTSSSSEDSPYQNLIAVSSLDKQHTVAILEYKENIEGGPKLQLSKMLSGHKGPVLNVVWNPHLEQYLLSSAQDATVRVWDVVAGVCTHIFGGHSYSSIGVAWSSFPELSTTVLSGGADYNVRLWDCKDFPADTFEEIKHDYTIKEKKEKKKKKANKTEEEETSQEVDNTATILTQDNIVKGQKKFLLTTIGRQMYPLNAVKLSKLAKQMLRSDILNTDKEDLGCRDDFIKIFGNTNDINAVLDMEMENHLAEERLSSWIILSVIRGDMAGMVEFATKRDLLCPFLVSLAPCVSFKYWKDTMQLYLAQIDRKVAKGEADKITGGLDFGGVIYRKVCLLLSVHDVKGAVNVLTEARLFQAAYVLSRTRHMDSIAEETLKKWAVDSYENGMYPLAAFCYIALCDPNQAAIVLSKINSEEYLSLAAHLAKIAGQSTFAEHIDDKLQQIHNGENGKTENLKPLPTRAELVIEKDAKEN